MAAVATPTKGKPGKGSPKGGSFKPAPKKTKKSFARGARLMGAPTTLIIPMSAVVMTRMGSPPDNLEVSCPKSISPSKRGARKGWRT